MKHLREVAKLLPEAPGVYIFRGSDHAVIYVGKAVNLRRRVGRCLVGAHDDKTTGLVGEIASINFEQTDSAIEALLLEAKLIKKHKPKINILAKIDKIYLYVWISREKFPRGELIRGTDIGRITEKKPRLFGPYISGQSLRAALDIIRKIVPFRSCRVMPKRKCLYGYLGLCDAPCVGAIGEREYQANIRQLISFLSGNKKGVLISLNAKMKVASYAQDYERAGILRDKINALSHIQDIAVLAKDDRPTIYRRIEGYDISNIGGRWATGSMVVFRDGQPEKSEYRKFRIKTVAQSNDAAMLAEVLERRLKHREWDMPDLILIDGGKPQINAALKVLNRHFRAESGTLRHRESSKKHWIPAGVYPAPRCGAGMTKKERTETSKSVLGIPIVGIAKGPDRKKDEFIFAGGVGERDVQLFKQVRDEAHRFARGYYELLHRRSVIKKEG